MRSISWTDVVGGRHCQQKFFFFSDSNQTSYYDQLRDGPRPSVQFVVPITRGFGLPQTQYWCGLILVWMAECTSDYISYCTVRRRAPVFCFSLEPDILCGGHFFHLLWNVIWHCITLYELIEMTLYSLYEHWFDIDDEAKRILEAWKVGRKGPRYKCLAFIPYLQDQGKKTTRCSFRR